MSAALAAAAGHTAVVDAQLVSPALALDEAERKEAFGSPVYESCRAEAVVQARVVSLVPARPAGYVQRLPWAVWKYSCQATPALCFRDSSVPADVRPVSAYRVVPDRAERRDVESRPRFAGYFQLYSCLSGSCPELRDLCLAASPAGSAVSADRLEHRRARYLPHSMAELACGRP